MLVFFQICKIVYIIHSSITHYFLVSPEIPSSGITSFWNYGPSNPLDFSHILRRFTYQLSPRSPAAPSLNNSVDQISSQGVGEVTL